MVGAQLDEGGSAPFLAPLQHGALVAATGFEQLVFHGDAGCLDAREGRSAQRPHPVLVGQAQRVAGGGLQHQACARGEDAFGVVALGDVAIDLAQQIQRIDVGPQNAVAYLLPTQGAIQVQHGVVAVAAFQSEGGITAIDGIGAAKRQAIGIQQLPCGCGC